MPDTDEFDKVLGDTLIKLFDPTSGFDADGLDKDIEYLRKKRDHMLEGRDLPEEDAERLTIKVDAQIRLLEETRDTFLASRKKDSD